MGVDQINTLEKRIGIRADGNQRIASGHLMRCLTIAKALGTKEIASYFFVADEESRQMLRQRMGEDTYPIEVLNSDYKKPEEEVEKLLSKLKEKGIGTILVDSYQVTCSYLEALSKHVKVAYLDDLYAMQYPVDMIINYDAQPDVSCYGSVKRVLTGYAYTPLREMFAATNYQVQDKIKKVLITAGGTYGEQAGQCLLPQLAACEIEREGIEVHLLLAHDKPITDTLKAVIEAVHFPVVLHQYIEDMASFLQQFDVILSAAGTTLYEVCALGIPSVSFVLADNQTGTAKDFANAQLIPCLGDLRKGIENKSFCSIWKELAQEATRREQSSRMRKEIDGQGANRIAMALCELMEE